MGDQTKIGWADRTWSPWYGCTKVSAGCTNCYAEHLMDHRYKRVKWGKGEPRVRTSDQYWKRPEGWNREAEAAGIRIRVFPSLCDPFDDEVPLLWLYDFRVMVRNTPHLDWLLVTKRADSQRCAETMAWLWAQGARNVWLIVSIEDQAMADLRVPHLLRHKAVVRGLSIEPQLGPVVIPGFNSHTSWCPVCQAIVPETLSAHHSHEGVDPMAPFDADKHTASVYSMIDWVIIGGESTQGMPARPFHAEWALGLLSSCALSGVPPYMKQFGSNVWASDTLMANAIAVNAGKPHVGVDAPGSFRWYFKDRAGADPAEWPEWARVQQHPEVTFQPRQ